MNRKARDWLSLRPWQRHSLVLTIAGLVYVTLGLVYMLTTVTPERARSLWLALSLMPMPAWGAVWILAGLCSIVSGRWPEFSDTWGYVALEMLSAVWSVVYLISCLRLHHWAGLSGAVTWAMVAFIWWAVAGLRNPTLRPELWIDPTALPELPDSIEPGSVK